ncbi:MAG: hypothetical protein M3154_08375, partial [Candidatus Eremiobacteraeota bacterium]|nr:hypothetical protein [Candidatus Eremiobacteraeota bacterium]
MQRWYRAEKKRSGADRSPAGASARLTDEMTARPTGRAVVARRRRAAADGANWQELAMVWSGDVFGATSNVGVPHGPAFRGAGAPLTALQLESWRLLRDEWAADSAAQTEWRDWDAGRTRAQPQAAALAHAFLAGEIDAPALRAAFDQHTRKGWDTFGLRGVSGAMFLNRLVKHARGTPFGPALDRALRAALRVPPNAAEAVAQLVAFTAFVRELGPGAQPALATAFVSAWWQLQCPAEWPAYQLSTRETLAVEESVFLPTGDPAADYGTFRTVALARASALALHPWAVEHLCWWHQRRDPAGAFTAELDAMQDEDGDDAAARMMARRPRRGRWRHAPGTYPSSASRSRVADAVAERSPEYVVERPVAAAVPPVGVEP